MKFLKPYLCFLLLLVGINGYSQNSASIRTKVVSLKSDSIILDTLSIVPGSLIFLDENKSNFTIDYFSSKLIWKDSLRDKADSLKVIYKVYPIDFSREFYKRKKEFSNKTDPSINNFYYSESSAKNKESIFGLSGFNKAGSISRGLSIGNNQDPIVNSSLNLQLSGKLSNGIEVVAAITDDNIPIQADGNTQQLQEFDKVFIQLNNEQNKVIVGDFDARNPEGYFMRYVKKAQGISYQYKDTSIIRNNQKQYFEASASAAISRGKFARQIIPGIESNQGPYRLRGAENEFFIIVLSGTEKVFLDGQLMERGQDRDYVIDYNTAEIKFTPKHIISKDSRIIIEFQYSDRNYARSMLTGNVNWKKEKFAAHINLYSEQDSKNQPVLQDLSDAQKLILANAGDNLNDAFYLNADSVAFNINEVLYAKFDTVSNGITYTIYRYSVSPDSAFFRLGFTNVGKNKGNYVAIDNVANGRIYQWVAPVNGTLQGDYEPFSILVSPKKRQMAVAGLDIQLSEQTKFGLETAITKNDINLFSDKDKSNDNGYALKFLLDDKRKLNSDSLKQWTVNTQLQGEFTNVGFTPVENYRAAEFTRDWNTNGFINAASENLIYATVEIAQNINFKTAYALKYYKRNNQYEGLMHQVNSSYIKNGWDIKGNISQLNTSSSIFNSDYFKTRDIIKKKMGAWMPGLSFEQENNKLKSPVVDSLLAGSFSWKTGEVFLVHGDTTRLPIKASFSRRYEDGLVNGQFKNATMADVSSLTMSSIKDNRRFTSTINYRHLTIVDTLAAKLNGDQSFSGRVEYSSAFYKRVIQVNTYYEGGTGTEPKRIYSYIKVADGTGVYTWNDYNSDGIPQLNEFEVAEFKDQANYIRIFSTTSDYTKVIFNQFNFSVNINPANLFKNDKFISRLAIISSLKIDNRLNSERFQEKYLLPVGNNYNIDQLIANQASGKHTLFYNRLNPKGGFEISYLHNENRQFLSSGIESRKNEVYTGTIRKSIVKSINLLVTAESGNKRSEAEFFANRNYKIQNYTYTPQLVYQPNSTYKILASYRNANKKNNGVENSNEEALINDISAEFKYSSVKKGVIGIKANYVNIRYNGDANTSLAYEMLEGLKSGENIKWQLSVQRNLGNSLQLSINYEGRKPAGLNIIHTGGMQLRAFF